MTAAHLLHRVTKQEVTFIAKVLLNVVPVVFEDLLIRNGRHFQLSAKDLEGDNTQTGISPGTIPGRARIPGVLNNLFIIIFVNFIMWL